MFEGIELLFEILSLPEPKTRFGSIVQGVFITIVLLGLLIMLAVWLASLFEN